MRGQKKIGLATGDSDAKDVEDRGRRYQTMVGV
jgi:hypothetical protein